MLSDELTKPGFLTPPFRRNSKLVRNAGAGRPCPVGDVPAILTIRNPAAISFWYRTKPSDD